MNDILNKIIIKLIELNFIIKYTDSITLTRNIPIEIGISHNNILSYTICDKNRRYCGLIDPYLICLDGSIIPSDIIFYNKSYDDIKFLKFLEMKAFW